MQKISYILTWGPSEDPANHDNLFAVLEWLARYPIFEPILVVQATAPCLEEKVPHPNCKRFLAHNPGPFSRSWGLNIGVRLSERPYLAFGDPDLIIGDALLQTFDHLERGQRVVKPCRRIVALDAADSARVRGGEFDWTPGGAASPKSKTEKAARGAAAKLDGVFIVEREAFRLAGTWDERFRDSSGEDVALGLQFERANIPVLDLDARPALRLHSARKPAPTDLGRLLLDDYRHLDAPQLARVAETQLQLHGYSEKYRPT